MRLSTLTVLVSIPCFSNIVQLLHGRLVAHAAHRPENGNGLVGRLLPNQIRLGHCAKA